MAGLIVLAHSAQLLPSLSGWALIRWEGLFFYYIYLLTFCLPIALPYCHHCNLATLLSQSMNFLDPRDLAGKEVKHREISCKTIHEVEAGEQFPMILSFSQTYPCFTPENEMEVKTS